MTRAKNFRRWFRNSKVVDEHGEPLVVWHGSPEAAGRFSVFDFDRVADIGMHFGTREAAVDASYGVGPLGQKKEGLIRPFYLSIQRPLEMGDPANWLHSYNSNNTVAQLVRKGVINQAEADDVNARMLQIKKSPGSASSTGPGAYRPEASRILRELIASKGYDGIVYVNENEDTGSLSWIVFYPQQIKLAGTGEDANEGTFDPENPDVRKNPPARKATRSRKT